MRRDNNHDDNDGHDWIEDVHVQRGYLSFFMAPVAIVVYKYSPANVVNHFGRVIVHIYVPKLLSNANPTT